MKTRMQGSFQAFLEVFLPLEIGSNFLHLKFTWSFKFNMNIIKMVGSYLKYYLGDKMKTKYSL